MPIRIHRFASARAAAEAAADSIAARIAAAPGLVLGLPTGHTVIPLYEALRMRLPPLPRRAELTLFNIDEFVGLGPEHPGSFRQFLVRHLLAHVPPDGHRTRFLDGAAPDLEGECATHERAIAAAGGLDLQLLGIGRNGHIGFNEPGPALSARTHRVRLLPETRVANAAWFNGDPSRVPEEALSVGIGTILDARRILLIATGHAKAAAVAGAVGGPLTTSLPASMLQLHPDVELYLDGAAASALPQANVKD